MTLKTFYIIEGEMGGRGAGLYEMVTKSQPINLSDICMPKIRSLHRKNCKYGREGLVDRVIKPEIAKFCTT